MSLLGKLFGSSQTDVPDAAWLVNQLNVLKVLAISGVWFLSSCAITTDQAQRMTSYDLCKVIYDHRSNAESRPIANEELRSRGYDCTRDRDAILTSIQIELQAGAAMGALGAQILQQSQPQQPIMIQQQRPTNCRIVRNPYGDRIYCN